MIVHEVPDEVADIFQTFRIPDRLDGRKESVLPPPAEPFDVTEERAVVFGVDVPDLGLRFLDCQIEPKVFAPVHLTPPGSAPRPSGAR
jgi:hypothetical protein